MSKSYTESFKRLAVRESYAPGMKVTEVARRHGVRDTTLHKWRKIYGEDHGFIPVAVSGSDDDTPEISPSSCRMVIEYGSERRIQIDNLVDMSALVHIIRAVAP